MPDPIAVAGKRPVVPGHGPADDRWWDREQGTLAGWQAGDLTERDIAALTALDCADDPPDEDWEWDLDPEQPRDADAPGCSVVPEALPGLLPRHLGTGAGFDAGGVADRVPPGPALAGLAAGRWQAGLARMGDDELAGLMIAWRRIGSWAAAGELAAVAELARRRQAQVSAGADEHLAEHVPDEVALVLTLTSWAAGQLVDRAVGLGRLPRTRASLAAGDIDVAKALVILSEVTGLDAPHAAAVEAAVIGQAPGWTTGELRRAVRRQVVAADPAAARKRKEQAARRARVERWAEDAGTAALAGRDLPTAEALAADAHLTAWATRLKQAGLDGTLDQLRAKVYLALLGGQPPDSLLPTAGAGAGSRSAGDAGSGSRIATASWASGTPPSPGSGVSPAADVPVVHGTPVVRGTVNLVIPLSTWLGWSQAPSEVPGFGPLDAEDSRALATALARDPASKWCITITGPGGRAMAHGCAKAGPGPPPQHPATQPPRQFSGQRPPERVGWAPAPDSGAGDSGRPGPSGALPRVRAWLAGISLAWLESWTCTHQRESPCYRPSPALVHLIQVRHLTCTAPGCRRPARTCDFEHTIPYQKGGRTCECNGGPCCRRHHRAKQATGWRLFQPRPGTFLWQPPHGRTYITQPTQYPA